MLGGGDFMGLFKYRPSWHGYFGVYYGILHFQTDPSTTWLPLTHISLCIDIIYPINSHYISPLVSYHSYRLYIHWIPPSWPGKPARDIVDGALQARGIHRCFWRVSEDHLLKMTIEIVDFPMNSMVIFHSNMLVYQRVSYIYISYIYHIYRISLLC